MTSKKLAADAAGETSARKFRNRIVRHAEVDPRTIDIGLNTHRDHLEFQRAAMGEALEGIGWLDSVIVNQTTGRLINGRMRVEEAIAAGEPSVPVDYVDLTEEEEATALATFDAIGTFARTNTQKLTGLLERMSDERATLGSLVQRVIGASVETVSAVLGSAQPAPTVRYTEAYQPIDVTDEGDEEGLEDDEDGDDASAGRATYFDASRLPDAPAAQSANAARACMIYVTTPDEETFKRLLTVLSFGEREVTVPGQRYAQIDGAEFEERWTALLGE